MLQALAVQVIHKNAHTNLKGRYPYVTTKSKCLISLSSTLNFDVLLLDVRIGHIAILKMCIAILCVNVRVMKAEFIRAVVTLICTVE